MRKNPLASAIKLVLVGAVAGSLAACGGSSDSGSATASESGNSVGPISGFGSVYVNGTRFRTDGSVRSNDGIEREDQLEKGMIVKVSGNWDDDDDEGEASEIDYDDTLRGALTSATWDDAENTGELEVAGQVVLLDGQTVFKGATPVELAASAEGEYRVRISAWRLDDGRFRASYVGSVNASSRFDDLHEVEVEGVVSGLDAQAEVFFINGLEVSFVSAEFDDDLSPGDLADGMMVEVEGRIENGVLVASEIDDEDDLFGDDEDVEISDTIQGDYDASAREFSLNGVTVRVDGETEFDDGMVEGDIADGLLVKVEGEFRGGVLVAEEIERRDADAELEARVSAIGDEEGFLTVGGVRVRVTSNTLIEGDDDDGRLTFADLQVDNYLEIEGLQRSDDGNYLEAFKIEREEAGDDETFELEARINATSDTRLTIAGLEFLTNGLNLGSIVVGSEVEVEYRITAGGEFEIIGIELEDDGEGND